MPTQRFQVPLPEPKPMQPQRRTYHAPAAPWATHSPQAQQSHYHMTDAERKAELDRRNNKAQPHLRTQYALEFQTAQDMSFNAPIAPSAGPGTAVSYRSDPVEQPSKARTTTAPTRNASRNFRSEIILAPKDVAAAAAAASKPSRFATPEPRSPYTLSTQAPSILAQAGDAVDAMPTKVEAVMLTISPPKSKRSAMPAKLRKRMEERAAMEKQKAEGREAKQRAAEAEKKDAAKKKRVGGASKKIKSTTGRANTKTTKAAFAKPVVAKAPKDKAPLKRSGTRTVLKPKDVNDKNNFQVTVVVGKGGKGTPGRKLPAPPKMTVTDVDKNGTFVKQSSMPNLDMFETQVVDKPGRQSMNETRVVPKKSPARPFSPQMNSTMKSPFGAASRSKGISPLANHVTSALGLVDYASDECCSPSY